MAKKANLGIVLIFALVAVFFVASPKGMASIGIPWEWVPYFNRITYILIYSQYQSDPLWYLYENYTSEYMGDFFRIAGLLGWAGKETGISHSY